MTKQFKASISKRTMRRKHRDGRVTALDRYILNYKDPETGKRVARNFSTRKEAESEKYALYEAFATGQPLSRGRTPTVAEAVKYWLDDCEGRVLPDTITSYTQVAKAYIIGPAVMGGTSLEKGEFYKNGTLPPGATTVKMLGDVRIEDLTTARIRTWNQSVLKASTPYVARLAKKHLASVLAMVGEDFGIRVPQMPRRAASGHRKKERILLRQDQVKAIFDHAETDPYGLYYVFLFMTGARPGEMLGLLWEDVDFIEGVINIRRNQDKSGKLKDFPKTAAGQRKIPMTPKLRAALAEWRRRCPRREGDPDRVFPALGYTHRIAQGQLRAGGALTRSNFYNRVWKPMLKELDLPPATPYAARHLAISNLQAQGVEVGMVARIAGHANPQITLQHYTHQVRSSAGVMDKLGVAYGLAVP